EAGCDFADLFEVKDALKKKGAYSTSVRGGALELVYERDTYRRTTTTTPTAKAKVDAEGLTFKARLPPHGSWSTELTVKAGPDVLGLRRTPPNMARDLERWLDAAPR